jgi:hypothetical protein
VLNQLETVEVVRVAEVLAGLSEREFGGLEVRPSYLQRKFQEIVITIRHIVFTACLTDYGGDGKMSNLLFDEILFLRVNNVQLLLQLRAQRAELVKRGGPAHSFKATAPLSRHLLTNYLLRLNTSNYAFDWVLLLLGREYLR